MDILFFLGLALALGFKHSYDADHLVAVSNLLVRSHDLRRTALMSVSWALGHMLTASGITVILFVFRETLLRPFLDVQLSDTLAHERPDFIVVLDDARPKFVGQETLHLSHFGVHGSRSDLHLARAPACRHQPVARRDVRANADHPVISQASTDSTTSSYSR